MMHLDNSSDCLLDAIVSFRLGREGQGSAALARLIDILLPRLEQHKSEITADDMNLLNDIITAQSCGDYLYVADLLEYLLPLSMLSKILALPYPP